MAVRVSLILLTLSACFASVLLTSCRQEEETRIIHSIRHLEDAFVESNIYLIALEEEAIDDFLDRYGWEMEQTGSGLRYKIHRDGEGPRAAYGNRVQIEYTVYLLTGDPVYSSKEKGPRSFIVGRGGVESGLEEGILLLNKGAKATFIMPFHLAHGVPGDGNKIPKRASIIYELEVIDLL